jgi:hypothetical protein
MQSAALVQIADGHPKLSKMDIADLYRDAVELLDERWSAFCTQLPGSSENVEHQSTGLPVGDLGGSFMASVIECILNTRVFDLKKDDKKQSLLDSVRPIGLETGLEHQLNEVITKLTIQQEQGWPQVYNAGWDGCQSAPKADGMFEAIKHHLEEQERKRQLEEREGKPLWRRLADLELVETAPHLWWATHTYQRHWTTHYHHHRHY